MKKFELAVMLSAVTLLLAGCSIISAARLPLERPPENLQSGLSRDDVDDDYGYPIAVGATADGAYYVEQLQFINGVPVGWKVFRICSHVVLDDLTLFLWEFIGWPIELMNSSYPEYVYFVIYDNDNKIIRAVPQNSDEGRKLSELPWTSRRLPPQSTNRKPTVRRLPVEERLQDR